MRSPTQCSSPARPHDAPLLCHSRRLSISQRTLAALDRTGGASLLRRRSVDRARFRNARRMTRPTPKRVRRRPRSAAMLPTGWAIVAVAGRWSDPSTTRAVHVMRRWLASNASTRPSAHCRRSLHRLSGLDMWLACTRTEAHAWGYARRRLRRNSIRRRWSAVPRLCARSPPLSMPSR